MKNKKIIGGFIIFVLLIISGVLLSNNESFDNTVSKDTKEISKNIIEEKIDETKEEVPGSEDSSIIVEKNPDENQGKIENDDLEVTEKPTLSLIDLTPSEMYINELYDGFTSEFTEIFNFGSEDEESSKSLREGIEIDLYVGHNSQKSWTIEELNEVIKSDNSYSFAATKDAEHIYGFYLDEGESFADIYETTLASNDEILFTFIKTIGFEQQINKVYSIDGVIIFELVDTYERNLIFSDLECVPIFGLEISLSLNVEDIFLGTDHWGIGFTLTGSKNDIGVTYSGSFYYGKYEGHHLLAVENEVYENGEPIVAYLKNKDEANHQFFINTYTNELISLNQESKLIDRTAIPPVVLEKSKNEYSNFYLALNYWGVLKKGMLFKNIQEIYYYDYKSKAFTTIERVDSRNLRFAQGSAYLGAYFYWEEGTAYYKFDEDSKSFVLRADKSFEYETSSWIGEYYVYDDLMYFYDASDIVYNAKKDAENFPDMKPISETPDILYKGEPVFITTTLKVNETEYIRTMVEGLLGTVEKGVFIPIIKGAVNRYDCSKSGIAYTNHSDVNKAFYYNLANNTTSELSVEGEALDVQIIDSYAYVLVDNRDIYRFDLEISTSNKLTADKILYSSDLVDKESDNNSVDTSERRYSRLDDNNNYLVFIGSEAYAALILDKELNIYDTLTGSGSFITEDGYIYYIVGIYCSRYEIASKEDILIHESYFHPILYHEGNIMFNSAYEGSGRTYLKNLYADEKQFFSNNVDYSIEIAMMYSTRIVIYDHKLKQLDYITGGNGDIKYELTEEGLYYWNKGSTDKELYPLRKNSKVEIYSAKRV